MDETLRRSAAHVLVDDVDQPEVSTDALHHLCRVLRLRNGDAVTVTDGAGRWSACTFTGEGVEPAGTTVAEPRPHPALTIAVAPPKGDRLEWLVSKSTEVGIDRIVLLDAERSVVRWDGDRRHKQQRRLVRIASEAAMQSRRVWLPEIEGPVAAGDVLGDAVVAEPGGRQLESGDTAVAIGPEGGWSPGELSRVVGRVSLGPNVLRVETAAVVASALMVSHR